MKSPQLNRLRRAHPALQSHLHVSFHNAFNEQILYFSKAAPGDEDRILVAVSLDPHASQEADFEVPLWLFGLSDSGTLMVEDLLSASKFHLDWQDPAHGSRSRPTLRNLAPRAP